MSFFAGNAPQRIIYLCKTEIFTLNFLFSFLSSFPFRRKGSKGATKEAGSCDPPRLFGNSTPSNACSCYHSDQSAASLELIREYTVFFLRKKFRQRRKGIFTVTPAYVRYHITVSLAPLATIGLSSFSATRKNPVRKTARLLMRARFR